MFEILKAISKYNLLKKKYCITLFQQEYLILGTKVVMFRDLYQRYGIYGTLWLEIIKSKCHPSSLPSGRVSLFTPSMWVFCCFRHVGHHFQEYPLTPDLTVTSFSKTGLTQSAGGGIPHLLYRLCSCWRGCVSGQVVY